MALKVEKKVMGKEWRRLLEAEKVEEIDSSRKNAALQYTDFKTSHL